MYINTLKENNETNSKKKNFNFVYLRTKIVFLVKLMS